MAAVVSPFRSRLRPTRHNGSAARTGGGRNASSACACLMDAEKHRSVAPFSKQILTLSASPRLLIPATRGRKAKAPNSGTEARLKKRNDVRLKSTRSSSNRTRQRHFARAQRSEQSSPKTLNQKMNTHPYTFPTTLALSSFSVFQS